LYVIIKPSATTLVTTHRMLSALRAPATRRILSSVPSHQLPKAQLRFAFNRRFTTPPPPPPPQKSNTALYAGIGIAIAGGLGYYLYTSSDSPGTALSSAAQAVKAKALTPKKEDYQKV
jgi:cytochrome c peroxidase